MHFPTKCRNISTIIGRSIKRLSIKLFLRILWLYKARNAEGTREERGKETGKDQNRLTLLESLDLSPALPGERACEIERVAQINCRSCSNKRAVVQVVVSVGVKGGGRKGED